MKTVYVSAEDVTLWEQAAVMASRQRRSTSWVVHQALRRYLRQIAIEEAQRAEGRQVVQGFLSKGNDHADTT